jgi:hypothetical protein
MKKAQRQGKQKDFWMRFTKDLIIHEKYPPKVINENPGTKFDSSWQTDHETPDDSGNGTDFLKELFRKFESHVIAWLMNTNDNIGTTTDSLTAFDNGKSDGW